MDHGPFVTGPVMTGPCPHARAVRCSPEGGALSLACGSECQIPAGPLGTDIHLVVGRIPAVINSGLNVRTNVLTRVVINHVGVFDVIAPFLSVFWNLF